MIENSFSVCGDVDVQIEHKYYHKLDGCEIIEGSLTISLMDDVKVDDLRNISFPLLREITGSLMLYRANGIKSLSQLFPNLIRIHGHKLFTNYALVVFENSDLESIDLKNLVSIERGDVRIERNQHLCYVNTINWDLIINSQKKIIEVVYSIFCVSSEFYSYFFFKKSNMFPSLCPSCPQGIKNCWSRENKQKSDCNCGKDSCNNRGECCDKNCLSCLDNDPNICTACKNFLSGELHNQTCVESCSAETFKVSEIETFCMLNSFKTLSMIFSSWITDALPANSAKISTLTRSRSSRSFLLMVNAIMVVHQALSKLRVGKPRAFHAEIIAREPAQYKRSIAWPLLNL